MKLPKVDSLSHCLVFGFRTKPVLQTQVGTGSSSKHLGRGFCAVRTHGGPDSSKYSLGPHFWANHQFFWDKHLSKKIVDIKLTALINGNTETILRHIPHITIIAETASFAVIFVIAMGRSVLVISAGRLTMGAAVAEVLVCTAFWSGIKRKFQSVF